MTVKMQGRIAGLIYLGVVATGILALAYAPSRLIVKGDPAATAAAMSGNGALFHVANYATLAMSAFFLALPFALSRFLSRYGPIAAKLMILFVVVSIPLTLRAAVEHFELAALAGSGDIAPERVTAGLLAYDRWLDYASIFWGLWLAPLGWLVLKSGAIPRILGVFLVLGCIEYLADYFGPMLFDGYSDLPIRGWMSWTSGIGEIGTCLWLLLMGAREPKGS